MANAPAGDDNGNICEDSEKDANGNCPVFDERCNDSTTDDATGIYTDGSNQMQCSYTDGKT